MKQENDEIIQLGDSIQLSGFKIVDSGEMVIIRKLVGTQVRKFQDMIPGFERLVIHLKPVHKTEKSMIFDLNSELIHEGKVMNAKTENRNLFMGVSELFSKFENMIQK